MEEILYYIGQGLGVVAIALGFINYQVKTRAQVLIVHTATTVCFTLHYMLIGAYVGMAMNFIGFVRDLVFYFTAKEDKVSRFWAIFFAVAMAAMGIISWQGWYSVFVFLGLVINSYSISFTNPQNIRKSILITSPLVIAYNCFVLSYGGIVYESVAIISAVIGIIKFRKKEKN